MSARLLVLGLLSERPQHGYELHKWLEVSRADRWAAVLPGSVYHALRQMEREGLVEMRATEHAGNRARAVYAITEAGQGEFGRLLRAGWERPPRSFPVALYTLLTFSDHVPVPEMRDALVRQIAALERELGEWREGEAAKMDAGALPEWGHALFENGCAHLEADLQLLRALRERLAP